MKKFLILFLTVFMLQGAVACKNQNVDFPNETVFEQSLNQGENVEGKTVSITVKKIAPQSAFGYNLQCGEHLNSVSTKSVKVNVGDTITLKVTEVDYVLGSYIIYYKKNLDFKQWKWDSIFLFSLIKSVDTLIFLCYIIYIPIW